MIFNSNLMQLIFLSATNPNLLSFVLIGIIVIILGAILRYFKQPFIIAYILAGVLMGKHGFALITNEALVETMGEFGLILLLFFIGMEISLPDFLKNWKVATLGTLLQIIGSILLVAIIGYFFEWQWGHIIVLGFVISLSSSAVIMKLLQDSNESDTDVGENVISILLMQDIFIVPMLIATQYLGGTAPTASEIILQIVGGVLLIGCMLWVLRKKEFKIPFSQAFEDDHELQVFFAFIVCFGFAVATSFFGLSAALGAFVAGMLVHSAKSTSWFHDSLNSFRVIFVALFFLSIGMLIEIQFIMANWPIVLLVLLAVYLTNHLINTLVLQYFLKDRKKSLYGGALLAQIGELGFVISSTSYYADIISQFEYRLTITVIALTLLISPFWILMTKRIFKISRREMFGQDAVALE